MKLKYLLYVLLLTRSLMGQSMLATLGSAVETGFGVYEPDPVTVTPDVMPVVLEPDLSNVVNLSDFQLTQAQKDMLAAQHFVVTPALHRDGSAQYNEIFDLYADIRDQGIPAFITGDAMLHSFHLCFDNILKTCEEERFFSQLNELLEGLSWKTREQYDAASDSTVRTALFRNLDYLLVATQLLVPKQFFTDPLPGGKYSEEISLIEEAAGFQNSPIFTEEPFWYQEDYSQYKPRGHYTKSDSLKQYFKTMMWLGRMSFSCSDTGAYSRTMTLSAVLMTQAIARLTLGSESGMDLWNGIYQPTVFFVGKSDDIHFEQYLQLIQQIYGSDFADHDPETFADKSLLSLFLEATENLEASAITYPGQPAKGFRFMGQRFIPDSWILDELVELKTPGRTMPTGLDIMTVLGPESQAENEWAFRYVSAADRNNSAYVNNLNHLKQAFTDMPETVWAQNAYWNWLYTLMPLLSDYPAGYPFFMRNAAWRDKSLYAALASWAELRHDTILYAKQSGSETSMPPPVTVVQGYVEPNPHLFGRLASLARFMIAGLDSRQLLFDAFRTSLQGFADLSSGLKQIAEKELTRTPLTPDEYQLIFDFGRQLFNIVTFDEYGSGPSPWSEEDIDPMPVIADVHTDINTQSVLEEGVGYPYAIYVLCNIEGEIVLTRGAGFSYYEFTWPLSQGRLTDEEWREMLNTGSAPERPAWTSSFISGPDHAESGQFYFWKRNWTLGLNLNMDKHILTDSDTLTARIKSQSDLSSAPQVIVEKPGGQEESLPLIRISDRDWDIRQPLVNWDSGTYYLRISLVQDGAVTAYRTHFKITTGSGVRPPLQPKTWQLEPASPNPFNPETRIRFSLPAAAAVRLSVLNLRGETVVTLLEGTLQAGMHDMIWNGRDRNHRPVSGGSYFIALKSEQRLLTQKVTCLR